MDWLPVNWTLIRNPLNWGIILLMVLIAGVGADLVLTAVTQKGSQDQ